MNISRGLHPYFYIQRLRQIENYLYMPTGCSIALFVDHLRSWRHNYFKVMRELQYGSTINFIHDFRTNKTWCQKFCDKTCRIWIMYISINRMFTPKKPICRLYLLQSELSCMQINGTLLPCLIHIHSCTVHVCILWEKKSCSWQIL